VAAKMATANNSWALICAVVILVTGDGSSLASQCDCADIPASSFSDTGICVPRQSDTSFCSLDWRHGDGSVSRDAQETANTEAAADGFIESTEGEDFSKFIGQETFESLTNYAEQNDNKLVIGAAAYLEQTRPESYDLKLVLASIAVVIGSTAGAEDQALRSILFAYLSEFSQQLFERLVGKMPRDAGPYETSAGQVTDRSAYGCFEIRRLSTDPGGFDLRVGMRTQFAEDSTCLRRE